MWSEGKKLDSIVASERVREERWLGAAAPVGLWEEWVGLTVFNFSASLLFCFPRAALAYWTIFWDQWLVILCLVNSPFHPLTVRNKHNNIGGARNINLNIIIEILKKLYNFIKKKYHHKNSNSTRAPNILD